MEKMLIKDKVGNTESQEAEDFKSPITVFQVGCCWQHPQKRMWVHTQLEGIVAEGDAVTQ